MRKNKRTSKQIIWAWVHQLMSILVAAAIVWAIANRLINTYLGIPGYLCYPDILAALYALVAIAAMLKVFMYFVTDHEDKDGA